MASLYADASYCHHRVRQGLAWRDAMIQAEGVHREVAEACAIAEVAHVALNADTPDHVAENYLGLLLVLLHNQDQRRAEAHNAETAAAAAQVAADEAIRLPDHVPDTWMN